MRSPHTFLLTLFKSALLLLSVLPTQRHLVHAYVSYANDFVNPDYIIAGGFGQNTLNAQKTIVAWAEELSMSGPWCEQ